jgi:hypothetical protein
LSFPCEIDGFKILHPALNHNQCADVLSIVFPLMSKSLSFFIFYDKMIESDSITGIQFYHLGFKGRIELGYFESNVIEK